MTRRALGAVLVGLALGVLLTLFGLTLMRVGGESMAPTLLSGELVLVVRPALGGLLAGVGLTRPQVADGSVNAIVDPQATPGGLLGLLGAPLLVKRVVGLPGQTVAYAGGLRDLNGAPAPEPWVADGFGGHFDVPATPLGPGELYVLGDNRLPLASRDSRAFGPVSLGALRGRVTAVLRWPRHSGAWRWPVVGVR